jgi:hypothetical protein
MGYLFGDSKDQLLLQRDPEIKIPASFVVALVLKTAITQAVTIGTAPGGNDIFNDVVTAGIDYEVAINKKFEADTILYIAGALTPATPVIVEVYKL